MTQEPSEKVSLKTFPTFDEFWDLIDFDPVICKHSIRDAYNTLAKVHQEEIKTLKSENEKLKAIISRAVGYVRCTTTRNQWSERLLEILEDNDEKEEVSENGWKKMVRRVWKVD